MTRPFSRTTETRCPGMIPAEVSKASASGSTCTGSPIRRMVTLTGAAPGAGLYAPEVSDATYRRLATIADAALSGGVSLIVDAAFLERARRRPVDELVDQDVIADQQVLLHRAARDLERLHDVGARERGEDHRDQQRLEVLSENGLVRHGSGNLAHSPAPGQRAPRCAPA